MRITRPTSVEIQRHALLRLFDRQSTRAHRRVPLSGHSSHHTQSVGSELR